MLSTDLARNATIPMGPDGVLLCGACLRELLPVLEGLVGTKPGRGFPSTSRPPEKGVRIGRICTACEHAAESCRCI
jgi:hypothetical protein